MQPEVRHPSEIRPPEPHITLGRPRRHETGTWLAVNSLGRSTRATHHTCPRCQYPMVHARGYRMSEVGSSLFAAASSPREWLLGLGRSPSGTGARRWGGTFSNTPFSWLDYHLRRQKLARAQSEIAANPHSLICPNCMHLEKR